MGAIWGTTWSQVSFSGGFWEAFWRPWGTVWGPMVSKGGPKSHKDVISEGSRTQFETDAAKSRVKVVQRGRKYEFTGVANVVKVLQILCKSHIPPFLKELVHRTGF